MFSQVNPWLLTLSMASSCNKVRISHLTVHHYSLTVMTSLYAIDKDLWDRNFLEPFVIDSATYLINSPNIDKVAMSLYNISIYDQHQLLALVNNWHFALYTQVKMLSKSSSGCSLVRHLLPSVLRLLHNHEGKGLVRLNRWMKCLWLTRPFDGAAAKRLLHFDI